MIPAKHIYSPKPYVHQPVYIESHVVTDLGVTVKFIWDGAQYADSYDLIYGFIPKINLIQFVWEEGLNQSIWNVVKNGDHFQSEAVLNAESVLEDETRKICKQYLDKGNYYERMML